MDKIIVLTVQNTCRLQYTLDFLEQQLGITFFVTPSVSNFEKSNLPKIAYHPTYNKDCLHIYPHQLLFESIIKKQDVNYRYFDNFHYLFYNTNQGFPFDILAAIFYCLSRYEEYIVEQLDHHQRFTVQQSIAYQYGFSHLPVVNQWINLLKKILKRKFPTLCFKTTTFRFIPSYDIDMATSFLYKGLYRTVGGFVRDLVRQDWTILKKRIQVIIRQQKDPFDVFDDLDKLHETFHLTPIYFLLLGQYSEFDKNLPPQHPFMQQLIQRLQQKYTLGIHPSYRSNQSKQQLQNEITHFYKHTQQYPKHNRQHYLILKFPSTYERLIEMGITTDYSMGYANTVGFRAGFAGVFNWYNLRTETTTPLKIIPFQIMDVTLKEYLNLSPQNAIETASTIINNTKAVNGLLCTIWHNSSFSYIGNWTEWTKVYYEVLQEVTKAIHFDNDND